MRHALLISALAAAFLAGPALAQDVAKGEQAFKKCLSCHSVADTTPKIGPHLRGIVGRPIASIEGFAYSQAMKDYAATAGAWDEAKLDSYLTKPNAVVAGTKMAFGGIAKAEERANIIAYLKTVTP